MVDIEPCGCSGSDIRGCDAKIRHNTLFGAMRTVYPPIFQTIGIYIIAGAAAPAPAAAPDWT